MCSNLLQPYGVKPSLSLSYALQALPDALLKSVSCMSRSDHLKPTMGDIELCRLFSLADEFKYMITRCARPQCIGGGSATHARLSSCSARTCCAPLL